MTADHEPDANGDDEVIAHQLESYFASHAQRISPRPPDVGGVMHRVRGHRRRRGAGLAVVGCAALLAATLVVVRAHGTEYPVAVGAGAALGGGGSLGSGAVSADTEGTSPTDSTPDAPPAPLQWQLVRPRAGLGLNQGTASAAGATYSISTAPGPAQDNSAHGTVYRTTDGVEWSRVAVPSGFAPTAVGGSSDQVYALGTVAAGGSLGISLLRGGQSGELGDPVTVPVDVDALSTDAGGPVHLLTGTVGAGHGHVTVVVTLQSDLASVVHAADPQIDTSHGVVPKGDGVDVFEAPPAPSSDSTTSTSSPAGSIVVPRFQKTVPHHYTWDELHLSDTQRAFVEGRPLLYQSADGANFTPVALPADALGRAYVVSTPDGYRLLSTSYASNATKVYASTDLSSWSALATFPGILEDAGVVDGHFVLATDAFPAGPVVHREAPNGTWSALALDDAAGTTGSSRTDHGWLAATIGPLGVAAVSWTSTGSTMTGTLIYSRDGVHPTVVPVPTTSDGVPTWMQSVQVSADAITVGLSLGRTTQPAGGPAMAAFVGVP